MIRGVEHIGLCAVTPKVLADWYCMVLGFRVVHAIEDRSTYFIRSQNGGMLEIYPAQTPADPVDNLHRGLRHIALAVTDV
jgi:catechol-2,3-dioxygenase